MPRKYKIKRHMRSAGLYKARPHPLFIIMMLLVAGALVYLGMIIYPPVYNLIMSSVNRAPPEPALSAPEPPLSAPEDDPLPDDQTPASVNRLRAVYAPPALVSDTAAFDRFLETLPEDINSVMVDIKNRSGQVLFLSSNQNAEEWGTIVPDAIDLAALNQKLGERKLSLIARMSAFRDDAAARAGLENAVNYRASGTTWLDNFPDAGGRAWLNPYSAGARQYLTGLALEAVEAGAVLVVFDDFHFPPNSLTGDAFFGHEAAGISRDKALSDFARALCDTLGEKGARAAVYMTVSAIATPVNLTLYNCPPERIAADTVLLGALSYQFPAEGFSSEEGLNITRPLEDPAATVRQAVSFALERLGETGVIALIQGGNEGSAHGYTAAQIRAQMDALAALGVEEYILYCTDHGNYILFNA